MVLLSSDHPEANGRKAVAGEQQWILTIPLEGGDELKLKLGKKGRDTIYGMMIAEESDDAREALEG
jgi:hypothetical protein